jgi:hypothetical protein
LLVVAIARYDSSSRLAPHPATAAKLPNLSLRGALGDAIAAPIGGNRIRILNQLGMRPRV